MSFATHHMNGNTLPPFPPSPIDLNDINPAAIKKTRGPYLLPPPWDQGSSGDSRMRCRNRKKPGAWMHIHDGFLKTIAGVPALSWTPGLPQAGL